MEVHVGRFYSYNFECGFCDVKFEDLDSLELHLRTCEMYECSECYLKLRDLSNMKKHAIEDHEYCKLIQHLKIDLENLSEVVIKSYQVSQL